MEQRRLFGRIPFGATTFMEVNGLRHSGSLIDISLKGALVRFETAVGLTKGYFCRLVVPLSDEVTLNFNAEVVHCRDLQAGLKFTTLDADTFSHLVRLLELNTGDAEQVEQELSFLTKPS